MTNVELVLPIRHTAQAKVCAEAERFNVLACGRRWGKTVLCLDLAVDDPLYGLLDGQPVGWFAGSSKIFDEVWRLALHTLHPIIRRTDSRQHRIETITGGVLDFWSLEGGDRGGAGRGRKYRRAVFDEVALVPNFEQLFSEAMLPTLLDLNGDAWFLSTPKGLQSDFYDLWRRGQPGKTKRDGWKSWQMPSHSNPHLSREALDLLKKEYAGRPLAYRQEILAEFVADMGSVFKLEWIHEGKVPDTGLVHYQGWDFAVTDDDLERGDYSVGVDIALDSLNRWWLCDLVRGRWNAAEVVERVLQLQRKHKASCVWMEGGPIGRAIEPWLVRRCRETAQHFPYQVINVATRGDKVVRTGPLVGAMANGSFYAPTGAEWLVDLKDELAAFPAGKHDDQVDALSLAFGQLDTVRTARPIRPKQNAPARPVGFKWSDLDTDDKE